MPTTNLVTFTPEAVKLIEETVNRVLHRRLNTPLRGQSEPDISAQDIYLARPPIDGIPGLTRAGTGGVPEEGDTPGSATCDIFSLINGEIVPAGYSREVYNLSTAAIPYDWIVCTKTKQGVWIASKASSVFHGITLANVNKGAFGNVSRLSGASPVAVDSVLFELGSCASGLTVYYMEIDGSLRAFAKEC